MWRFGQPALELEQRGLVSSAFPQSDVRMVPAPQRLRDAIVEHRLVLPEDRELALHASNAVQRQGRRGWRLERPDRSTPIDAIVALAIALERTENRPAPPKLIGWI